MKTDIVAVRIWTNNKYLVILPDYSAELHDDITISELAKILVKIYEQGHSMFRFTRLPYPLVLN
jgi:hypothetical protein